MVNHTPHKHGEPNTKARKVINMAIGSVAKIPEMVDDGRYCPEIIQQIDSVVGLLHSARKDVLKSSLQIAFLLQERRQRSLRSFLIGVHEGVLCGQRFLHVRY